MFSKFKRLEFIMEVIKYFDFDKSLEQQVIQQLNSPFNKIQVSNKILLFIKQNFFLIF